MKIQGFRLLIAQSKEMLWLFVFVIGFIFQQRRSQYIIKIYRTTESKVMTVRICIGIRFPLSSYMIYYGPQLDIWVKTFARKNSPESSLLISWCLHRYPALCGDPEERVWPFCICDGLHFSITTVSTYNKNLSDNQVESYDRPNLRQHSISTFERNDILLGSIGHPSQNFRVSEFSRVFLVSSWASQ